MPISGVLRQTGVAGSTAALLPARRRQASGTTWQFSFGTTGRRGGGGRTPGFTPGRPLLGQAAATRGDAGGGARSTLPPAGPLRERPLGTTAPAPEVPVVPRAGRKRKRGGAGSGAGGGQMAECGPQPPGGGSGAAGAPSRHEKSLGLLTTKFVSLLQEAKDGVLDLKLVRGLPAGWGGRAPGGAEHRWARPSGG